MGSQWERRLRGQILLLFSFVFVITSRAVRHDTASTVPHAALLRLVRSISMVEAKPTSFLFQQRTPVHLAIAMRENDYTLQDCWLLTGFNRVALQQGLLTF